MRAPILPPPAQPQARRAKRGRSMLVGFLGLVFTFGVVSFVLGSAAAGYVFWKASQDLPSYDGLAKYEPQVMTRIHANDGQMIAEYGRERRIFVPINTIPKLVLGAYLSAEDKRFYEHGGLDFIGIGRALVKAAENRIKGSDRRDQGASTITQQVAKNFLLSSDRSIERKVKEAILAIRIERAYSKDKILELYLNEIFLGLGSYGVAAAALNYYNKELKDLEPHEAAYLAALPKGPNNYHPFRDNTKDAAIERRNWILGEMVQNGYITRDAAEVAKKKPLGVNLRPAGAHIFAAEFFAEEVRRAILAQYGEDKLYGGGMSVRTTLDPVFQSHARNALIAGLVKFDRERGWRGPVNHIDIAGNADWGPALASAESEEREREIEREKEREKARVKSKGRERAANRAEDKASWRFGVVLDVQPTKVTLGVRPQRRDGAALAAERQTFDVQVSEFRLTKAGSERREGEAVDQIREIVRIGDVVWLTPRDAARPQSGWAIRQVAAAGWAPVTNIPVEWGGILARVDVAGDIQPWRLGTVLDVQRQKIVVGLRPPKLSDGKIAPDREGVEIQFDEMKWTGKFVATDRPKGPAPKQPSDVVKVGDVIWVSPKDETKPQGAWTLQQIPEVGGGLVAMDPHTGRVLAVAGGFSFDISQFDRAMQAKRQPGSSFKPLVYAAALDNGYKPTSIVLDAPIEIEQAGSETWKPENYNKSGSLGPATLRTGIEKSRNQMTARLGQDLGMPLIVEYSRRFGVYDDLLPVPAMVLGAGETTLLKMTAAYAMIANGGKEVKPTLIDRIQDRWGRAIWRHDTRTCASCKAKSWASQTEPELVDDRKQIVDPHTAYQMTSIMEGVVQRGTATVLKEMVPGVPLAGKTGTTNDSKDTWFVGYSADLVVGVYVGYDTPKPMGKTATGGAVSAPLFGHFMKLALAGKKPTPFRQPPGLRMVRINPLTGLRAGPTDKGAIWEAFKPYEEPDDPSSMLGYDSGEIRAENQPSSGFASPRGLY